MCGNIFEDRKVQLYLNVHRRFGGDLVKSSGYMMILILVYAKSLKVSAVSIQSEFLLLSV